MAGLECSHRGKSSGNDDCLSGLSVLQSITNNSCNRELNLISAIFSHAQKEWDLGNFTNPVRLIKRPPYDEKPRKERWSNEEVHRIYEGCDFTMVKNLSGSALHLLCTIFGGRDSYAKRRDLLHTKKALLSRRGYVFLPNTKNGEEREVPRTDKAIEILDILCKGLDEEDFILRGQNSDSLGANFRRMKKKVGLSHKHFHDSRHEAASYPRYLKTR